MTTRFCSFASGSQGVTAPWSRNLKNASPRIKTLGERRADTTALTVDFPAPGGPAITSRDDIDAAFLLPACLVKQRVQGFAHLEIRALDPLEACREAGLAGQMTRALRRRCHRLNQL